MDLPYFFALHNGSTIIGRSSSCRFRIPLISVSKKHCQIQVDDNDVKISDLGSRNGTFVNNIPILEPHPIKAGDNLKIGPVKFIFQINGQPDFTKKDAPKQEVHEQAPPASQVTQATSPSEPAQPARNKEEDVEFEDDLDFLADDLADFEEDKDSMESNT